MGKSATTWTFPDLPGYVEKRGEKASSRWQHHGKNFRLTHPIPFHPKNRSLIHGLHRRFVEDILRGSFNQDKGKPKSLFAARDEYFEAHAKVFSATSRMIRKRAISYFFDVDMGLDWDTLYKQILKRNATPPKGRGTLNQQTRRAYLTDLRAFCQWLVASEYITKNPLTLIGIPGNVDSKVIFWEPTTMQAIVEHYYKRARESTKKYPSYCHLQRAIFLNIMALTGGRPGELIRVRIEDISDDKILLFGKASPKRGAQNTRTEQECNNPRACRDENARMREIPLINLSLLEGEKREWQRRLQEALEEARSYSRRNDGWLTMYKHVKPLGAAIREYKEVKNIKEDPRTLYNFRHGARWYLENVVKLDPFAIADILGHTPQTSFQNYRPTANAKELADRIISH